MEIAPDSYLQTNNGETSNRSGIGIIPGKEFWMRIGRSGIQLVFPPLSDNATSFNFTEGEKGGKRIQHLGIQLKARKLPELALPQNAVSTQSRP